MVPGTDDPRIQVDDSFILQWPCQLHYPSNYHIMLKLSAFNMATINVDICLEIFKPVFWSRDILLKIVPCTLIGYFPEVSESAVLCYKLQMSNCPHAFDPVSPAVGTCWGSLRVISLLIKGHISNVTTAHRSSWNTDYSVKNTSRLICCSFPLMSGCVVPL